MMNRNRPPLRRAEFLTRAQLDQVFAAGGPYYLGRMVLGEVGVFRANRSLRDVEPEVNLFLRNLTGGSGDRQ